LDRFAVLGFVASGEVFEALKITTAIENLQRRRVHFADCDMEMRPPFLDMADHETRPISADAEFGVDRSEETRQLGGRHIALWRYGEMAHAVSAALRRSQRMRIVQRLPIARQNLDALVLVRLIQQVTGKVSNAAGTADAR